MSNGFLSQEEIDALLNGGGDVSQEKKSEPDFPIDLPDLTDLEKDLLGEIGNISMGSASTALSTIINQQVNITTPVVSVTTLKILKSTFESPNIALEVKFTSGIVGENLLVMKVTDASVIGNLMMGGNGVIDRGPKELSEIEISAVSEAMNQMIGSAATSMATMFAREVNISPPLSKVWNGVSGSLSEDIDENEALVRVSFSMKIGTLVDSSIMQLLPMDTAKKVVGMMMGQENDSITANIAKPVETENLHENKQSQHENLNAAVPNTNQPALEQHYNQPPIEVHKANFQSLEPSSTAGMPKNIDLILDVPLGVSVVLGRTKKNIKDILNFSTGSLIELDKLAEEPVEILVNGKKIAYGEVVVIDENFGVRITSICSSDERVKSLGK